MTWEIIFLFSLMGILLVLFITEIFPMELVAMFALLALVFSNILTLREALSGASSSAVIIIASMFVISGGLVKVGAVNRILSQILRFPLGGEVAVLAVICAIVFPLSAFLNNTTIVAIFIPMILKLSKVKKISPSRLLIPLSFVAIGGGLCTLVGTSTNIIVNDLAQSYGHPPLPFFEFAKMGLILGGFILFYLLFVGRHLLPKKEASSDIPSEFGIAKYITEIEIEPESSYIGKSLIESRFESQLHVTILGLVESEVLLPVDRRRLVQEKDRFLVMSHAGGVADLSQMKGISLLPEFSLAEAEFKTELAYVEALVPPTSRLIGRRIENLDFIRFYNVTAVGMKRVGALITTPFQQMRLRSADVILLQGKKEDLEKVARSEELIILEEVKEYVVRPHKLPHALVILAGVLFFAIGRSEILPLIALVGACLMIATGCLKMREAYDAIDWTVIFLIVGMWSLGVAMEKTGAAAFLANQIVLLVGQWGPTATLLAIYILAQFLTEILSNAPVVFMMLPVVMEVASTLHVSSTPFIFALAYAASMNFVTPIGYQTHAMVYIPGRYRFADYLKVGLPIDVVSWVLIALFVPKIWPF